MIISKINQKEVKSENLFVLIRFKKIFWSFWKRKTLILQQTNCWFRLRLDVLEIKEKELEINFLDLKKIILKNKNNLKLEDINFIEEFSLSQLSLIKNKKMKN